MAYSCIACSIDRVSPGHRFANDQHTCEKNSSERSDRTYFVDHSISELIASTKTANANPNTNSAYTSNELAEDNTSTASAYTFDSYQEDAGTTAIYPDYGKGTPAAFAYLCLKLNGEAGEVGETYAKYLRGDYDFEECKRLIGKEIGDALWYLSQITDELGASFGEVAAANIHKLNDRKSRDVLHGSGDDR